MDNEILSRFYPFNLLSREALESIETYADVRLFHDEDYVFRLGEPLKDLYYVLDGTVHIMDIENRTNEILSHDSEQARHPFTHDVSASAVAVAKPGTRVLMVSFEQLWRVFPQERDRLLRIRPSRQAEPEPLAPGRVEESEPEHLELPAEIDENIRLINSQAQARSQAKPAKKAKPASTPAPKRTARATPGRQAQRRRQSENQAPARQQPAKVGKATAQMSSKAQRMRVSRMMSGLKDFLNSDITLEPPVNRPKEPEQKAPQPAAAPADSDAQKRRATSVTQLLSGAREILYSEIKLQPRHRDTERVSAQPDGQVVEKEAMTEAEYREVEMQEYMRAMALYKQQKWDSAHAAFKALYSANPRTNLYREYVNRCEEHVNAPGR